MENMEYISERWHSTLQQNHADNFEALWQLQQDNWFEAPNYRRGGWSGVCKAVLSLEDGTQANVFIKRQENHFYRSWRHFFQQRPTFEREFRKILAFNKYGIPAVELLYYGQRMEHGKLRAILVTRELEGYQALGDDQTMIFSGMDFARRKRLFGSVAAAMRQMHAHRFQHSCPYPKHLFVKAQADGSFQTCFIDLEKARRRLSAKKAGLKDLGILHRHTRNCSRTDRLRFFLAYRQEKRLSKESKAMLATITQAKKPHAGRNAGAVDAASIEKLQEVS
ncbi:MAG: hypothetical protein CVU35_05700 [Betaproteobacteria bacterium HGW-Betaproteobacteria-8]|nr:MAG: hypothetical protein CVU35_05700 [Betaproteobacteria bacterium HGW-Betaproteobacteria-8]